MEIKTSKIKEVNNVNPWHSNNGTIYYHHLTLENGDKIDIGKKSEQKVGWEVTYKLVGDPGQHEFTKAKSEKKEGPLGGKSDFSNNRYMNGSKSSQASFALAYAKDYAGFHIAQGVDYSPEQITETAGVFNKWLQENA